MAALVALVALLALLAPARATLALPSTEGTETEIAYLTSLRAMNCRLNRRWDTETCGLNMENFIFTECGKPHTEYVCHEAIGYFVDYCRIYPSAAVCYKIETLTKKSISDLKPPYLVAA